MANKKAPTRPGKAAGNTTFIVVSALVAPSPKEPSLKDCGTELIISSDNDDIKIEVKKAEGSKCPRCWKILETKCDRCQKVNI